jgi:hypothetical protein
VCRRILEQICNQENHAILVELSAHNCWMTDATARPRNGRTRLLDLINALRTFVPDLQFHICDEVVTDSRATVRWAAAGRPWAAADVESRRRCGSITVEGTFLSIVPVTEAHLVSPESGSVVSSRVTPQYL